MDCAGCCGRLREEFRVKKLGLSHDDPSLFVKPQCGKPVLYVVWSIFWAVFHVAMLMLEIYYLDHLKAKWFVFITNLAYLIEGMGTVWDCLVTCYVYWKRQDILNGSTAKVTWYIQVQWTFFNLIITNSIMVTIIYYVLLNPAFSHHSINKHLLNTVYTVLLLSFSAKPVHLLHCYFSMIFASLYTVFSVIYQEVSGYPVYDAFDWTKAGSTSIRIVLFIFVGIPIVQAVCFAWYMVRLYVWRACCGQQEAYNVDMEMGEPVKKKPSELGEENATPLNTVKRPFYS